MYDKIIFNKIRDLLGGKVRVVVSGSAPISSSVLDMLKICFCCAIGEAYGLTETGGAFFMVFPYETESGHVGGPVQGVRLRLKDIPEMNYLSSDNPPRG